MTWSRPLGFRLPGTVSLPIMSRALERYAWPTWREEAIRTLAVVVDELLRGEDEGTSRDDVLRALSHAQVGEDDLVISRGQGAGLLVRAAEFLDVAHAVMHRPSALPLPPRLDLRCTAQFMDDPQDVDTEWIYVLLGTERTSMEAMFGGLPDVEAYPVPEPDDLSEGEPAVHARATIWQRVIGRYVGFSPPSIVSPELTLTFDLVESIGSGADADLAGSGKITVAEVVAQVAQLRQEPVDELRHRLLQPVT